MPSTQTILIFGGTFDPPHRAHIELPRMAMRAIVADELWYIPAAISPFKTDAVPTPAHHRLAMLKLAIADRPNTRIITYEIDHAHNQSDQPEQPNTPSYTIDTLRHFREQLPHTTQLRLLIGTDQARAFHRWKSYADIEKIAEPLVMIRPPVTAQTIDTFLANLPASFDRDLWQSRIIIPPNDCPPLDISATDIRQRLAHQQPITDLVPTPVAHYIKTHNLYPPTIPSMFPPRD